MGSKVAIIAALPREIAGLTRGVVADAALLRRGVHLYRVDDAVIVAAGMGAQRAAVAVEAALAESKPDVLISVGLAGGCVVGIEAGAVLEAQVVVDTLTGERFEAASKTIPPSMSVTLATAGEIANVAEKKRLAAACGALLVDMEAATVARLAFAHGLPFRAIKGVSDEFDFELEALGQFAGEYGIFRTGAFAMYIALRPRTWGKAIELGRGSAKALQAMDQAVKLTLDSYRVLT